MRIHAMMSGPVPRSQRSRKGFTLLEVLLSAAIGVLLMAALYVAMNVQLEHAQAGREAVEQSLLVRALMRRMSNDIAPALGPTLPDNTGSAASAASPTTSSAGSSTAGGTAPSTSTTTPGSTNSSNTSSSTTSNAPILGLQGDSERLILWVGRISSDLNYAAGQPITSDLRRITYWLVGGSGAPLGLARQEVKQATSDDALITTPPGIADETSYVIAEEVQSVSFRYFDGTSWQDNWDATQADATTGAPIGPPQAVEITLGVAPVNSANAAPDASNLKTYRHVVAIPTANGTSPPPSNNSSSNTQP